MSGGATGAAPPAPVHAWSGAWLGQAIAGRPLIAARRGDVLHPFELAEAIASRIAGARLVEDDGAVPLDVRVRRAGDRIAAFYSAVESAA